MASYFHASELEPDTYPLSHPQTRYLPGRLPTASPNPRGKHHRKPLPWKRSKLSTADGYDGDARLYREWLWGKQKKEKKRLPTRRNKFENESGEGEDGNEDVPSGGPPNSHILKLIDAHVKRHRRIGYRCTCCWEPARGGSVQYRRREWKGIVEQGMGDARDGEWLPGEGIAESIAEGEWWEGDDGVLRMEDVEVRGVEFVLRYKSGWKGRYLASEMVEEEEQVRRDGCEEEENGASEESEDGEEVEWEFVRCHNHCQPQSVSDHSEWLVVGVRSESGEDGGDDSEEEFWG